MAEKRIIYADNAATSPLSQKALDAMLPFLRNDYANASQPYSFSRECKKALQKSRETIAECIGARPEEIYFTSGGSESNNWAINGAMEFETDIISSRIEHNSVLKAVDHAARLGFYTSLIPVNKNGVVQIQDLQDAIVEPGSFVSIMYANNEIGTIQYIKGLADAVHEKHGIFHTDAVQAVGHIGINVRQTGIDLMSASAHKFNGPKGIGFLYIREGLKWPPLIYGGSQEYGFRAGTENVASVIGMATALEENITNLAENTEHLRKLEDTLCNELYRLGIAFTRNGYSRHIPGNISLSFEDMEGEVLLHRLDLCGIMISTGSACDSKDTQISHVLKAIDLNENLAKGTIRISFGKQNSPEEAVQIARRIASIINPDYKYVFETWGLSSKTSRPYKSQTKSSDHYFKDNEDIKSQSSATLPYKERIFYINCGGNTASGKLTKDGKIIILKGSILRQSLTDSYKRINFREEIINNYCTLTSEGYLVNIDLPPMALSAASGLVQARSSNGKVEWKDVSGVSLGYYMR